MTARLMFSDFRISTWVSTVAESTAMSPSTDCCWNSCTLRVSITIDAVEVYNDAAVNRYSTATIMHAARIVSIVGNCRRTMSR